MLANLDYRNEAGILTARKDLDYIGRDELLEALKRVGRSKSAEYKTFSIICFYN